MQIFTVGHGCLFSMKRLCFEWDGVVSFMHYMLIIYVVGCVVDQSINYSHAWLVS